MDRGGRHPRHDSVTPGRYHGAVQFGPGRSSQSTVKGESMSSDRIFDVYEACYAYAAENHTGQWSRAYALFAKLHRKHFNPGLSIRERGWEALSEEGLRVYCRMKAMNY
jgi:hypothetical protein